MINQIQTTDPVTVLRDRINQLIGGTSIAAKPILDVGLTGQIRAGRDLAAADFTTLLGRSAPVGLWNFSNGSTDASGNGRNLTNKNAAGFGTGVGGVASTAAQFTGSATQAFYVADTGTADTLRLRTGSFGAWVRVARRPNIQQGIMGKWGVANQSGWLLYLDQTTSRPSVVVSLDGVNNAIAFTGTTVVADERWHHVVGTYDGLTARLYVDGVLDSAVNGTGGPMFPSSVAFNVGSIAADAATNPGSPFWGRIDEAFVTADVLDVTDIRVLYAAKIAHGAPTTPSLGAARLSVTRRRLAGSLATSDFPTTPLRLHGFTAGALTDQGSNNLTLTATGTGTIAPAAGPDGRTGTAISLSGSHTGLASTDAGLPSGTAARSYGCWFKTTSTNVGIMGWGTSGTADARTMVHSSGVLLMYSASTPTQGSVQAVNDNAWHHFVVTEDGAAADGLKRRCYLDGALTTADTALATLTLAGANHFRVGANPDATNPFIGQIDSAFVTGYVLTADQVRTLYLKTGVAQPAAPVDLGTHVPAIDATNAYVIFDNATELPAPSTVDLRISA